MLMAIVTATLFLLTNLHPNSVESGNHYFSVIFFFLISLMFGGFAEDTLTVRSQSQPAFVLFPVDLGIEHFAPWANDAGNLS